MDSNIKIVSAGIIEDQGKILLARRQNSGSFGGKWEFPGGKQEPNENIEECLIREIQEEFGVLVEPKEVIGESIYKYDRGALRLIGLRAIITSGNLELRVHDECAWVSPSDLHSYDLAPADIPLADIIKDLYE